MTKLPRFFPTQQNFPIQNFSPIIYIQTHQIFFKFSLKFNFYIIQPQTTIIPFCPQIPAQQFRTRLQRFTIIFNSKKFPSTNSNQIFLSPTQFPQFTQILITARKYHLLHLLPKISSILSHLINLVNTPDYFHIPHLVPIFSNSQQFKKTKPPLSLSLSLLSSAVLIKPCRRNACVSTRHLLRFAARTRSLEQDPALSSRGSWVKRKDKPFRVFFAPKHQSKTAVKFLRSKPEGLELDSRFIIFFFAKKRAKAGRKCGYLESVGW